MDADEHGFKDVPSLGNRFVRTRLFRSKTIRSGVTALHKKSRLAMEAGSKDRRNLFVLFLSIAQDANGSKSNKPHQDEGGRFGDCCNHKVIYSEVFVA